MIWNDFLYLLFPICSICLAHGSPIGYWLLCETYFNRLLGLIGWPKHVELFEIRSFFDIKKQPTSTIFVLISGPNTIEYPAGNNDIHFVRHTKKQEIVVTATHAHGRSFDQRYGATGRMHCTRLWTYIIIRLYIYKYMPNLCIHMNIELTWFSFVLYVLMCLNVFVRCWMIFYVFLWC